MEKALLHLLIITLITLIASKSLTENIDMSNFNSAQGFTIEGAAEYNQLGKSISSAGDFNGDGYDDIVIGAPSASSLNRNMTGSVYILFGPRDGSSNIDILNITKENGFAIIGANPNDQLGCSVSKAGDINGDGIDDIVIGAEGAGNAYVIFGRTSDFSDIDLLKGLGATEGFAIISSVDDHFGGSVSGAGDINGDGIDDIVIGAHLASPEGRTNAGSAYVIFGSRDGLTNINISKNFEYSQGFAIYGSNPRDHLGASVSGAGDINGDGIKDIVIGAQGASPSNKSSAGTVYAIFGSAQGFSNIDLNKSISGKGFKIDGANAGDQLGVSISSAGDINGDGIGDLVLGTPNKTVSGKASAGSAYVIYGKRGELPDIDLSNLNAAQGFTILGGKENDNLGISVSGAGDVNGDGLDDIVLGAWTASPLGRNLAGVAYVILGTRKGFKDIDLLQGLDTSEGFAIFGDDTKDHIGVSVSGAGDINADGIDDILIGSVTASPLKRKKAGRCFVILSSNFGPVTSGDEHPFAEGPGVYLFAFIGFLVGIILAVLILVMISKRNQEKRKSLLSDEPSLLMSDHEL